MANHKNNDTVCSRGRRRRLAKRSREARIAELGQLQSEALWRRLRALFDQNGDEGERLLISLLQRWDLDSRPFRRWAPDLKVFALEFLRHAEAERALEAHATAARVFVRHRILTPNDVAGDQGSPRPPENFRTLGPPRPPKAWIARTPEQRIAHAVERRAAPKICRNENRRISTPRGLTENRSTSSPETPDGPGGTIKGC